MDMTENECENVFGGFSIENVDCISLDDLRTNELKETRDSVPPGCVKETNPVINENDPLLETSTNTHVSNSLSSQSNILLEISSNGDVLGENAVLPSSDSVSQFDLHTLIETTLDTSFGNSNCTDLIDNHVPDNAVTNNIITTKKVPTTTNTANAMFLSVSSDEEDHSVTADDFDGLDKTDKLRTHITNIIEGMLNDAGVLQTQPFEKGTTILGTISQVTTSNTASKKWDDMMGRSKAFSNTAWHAPVTSEKLSCHYFSNANDFGAKLNSIMSAKVVLNRLSEDVVRKHSCGNTIALQADDSSSSDDDNDDDDEDDDELDNQMRTDNSAKKSKEKQKPLLSKGTKKPSLLKKHENSNGKAHSARVAAIKKSSSKPLINMKTKAHLKIALAKWPSRRNIRHASSNNFVKKKPSVMPLKKVIKALPSDRSSCYNKKEEQETRSTKKEEKQQTSKISDAKTSVKNSNKNDTVKENKNDTVKENKNNYKRKSEKDNLSDNRFDNTDSKPKILPGVYCGTSPMCSLSSAIQVPRVLVTPLSPSAIAVNSKLTTKTSESLQPKETHKTVEIEWDSDTECINIVIRKKKSSHNGSSTNNNTISYVDGKHSIISVKKKPRLDETNMRRVVTKDKAVKKNGSVTDSDCELVAVEDGDNNSIENRKFKTKKAITSSWSKSRMRSHLIKKGRRLRR